MSGLQVSRSEKEHRAQTDRNQQETQGRAKPTHIAHTLGMKEHTMTNDPTFHGKLWALSVD